jgi:hypothetical protein
LADSQVITGKQLIAVQKAKENQQEEFVKASEFEQRHKRSKKSPYTPDI